MRCDPDEPRRFGTHVGCHARDDSPYLPSVAGFVARIRALRPDPRQLVVAAIYGAVDAARTVEVGPDPDDPTRPMLGYSCSGGSGLGKPPLRLADFVDALGGTAGRVCDDDQTGAMTAFGARISAALGVPCFAGTVHDADPAARVQQGALEGSNVSPVETMVAMISAARQFEAQMKMLQGAEQREQNAAKLLGPVA